MQKDGGERICQAELWIVKDCNLVFFDSFSNCVLKDGSLGWNYLFGK